jgi:D-inositol-3-phosphate glycosyltransferase
MKKKVAFISEHASPLAVLGGVDNGGQNVYVAELARNLVELGFLIDIFTRWDNPEFPEVIDWVPGVRVIHVKAGPVEPIEKEKLLPFMSEFRDNMAAFIDGQGTSYELIHANFWMSALVAADLKQSHNIPFVVTFHALGYVRKLHQNGQDKFPPERIALEKRAIDEADRIIAECPQDEEDLIAHYGADKHRIVTIPCGFNPHEFYPTDRLLARRLLKLDANDLIMLQLGRMVPRKGVDNAIRAVACIRKNGLPAKLVVVGGETDDVDPERNPEIARLQKIAAEEGVADYVIFTGRKSRDILRYYYSAADAFVTTPWYEPFGITPLEAMACGTPVIGSDVGGIKYSVEDGKTGFLVPPNNPEALAERVCRLLSDQELLKRMKQQAVRRANALFRWSQVAEKMAKLYFSVGYKTSSGFALEEDKRSFIEQAFQQASTTMLRARTMLTVHMADGAQRMVHCFKNNKKILVCGNGGSASESHHLVAELLGRFELANRPALPALALTADTSFITAWSNDIGYADIFARQVEAYGQPGDILFCFSTSGNSENVIQAMKVAREQQMTCIALTGKYGGDMALYADINIIVPSTSTQRIQELHLHILHTLCSLVETELFGKIKSPATRNGKALKHNGARRSLQEAENSIKK